jgi:hypothetical protein
MMKDLERSKSRDFMNCMIGLQRGGGAHLHTNPRLLECLSKSN